MRPASNTTAGASAIPPWGCAEPASLLAAALLCSTVYDFDGELGQLDVGALGAEAGVDLDLSSVIVVGRKDYVLRSVHPQVSVPFVLPAHQAWRRSQGEACRWF